jgi:hypothetical protein
MPAQSEAQRRFLYAKFGEAWVRRHHFDNPGALPRYAGQQKRHASGFAELARVLAERRTK